MQTVDEAEDNELPTPTKASDGVAAASEAVAPHESGAIFMAIAAVPKRLNKGRAALLARKKAAEESLHKWLYSLHVDVERMSEALDEATSLGVDEGVIEKSKVKLKKSIAKQSAARAKATLEALLDKEPLDIEVADMSAAITAAQEAHLPEELLVLGCAKRDEVAEAHALRAEAERQAALARRRAAEAALALRLKELSSFSLLTLETGSVHEAVTKASEAGIEGSEVFERAREQLHMLERRDAAEMRLRSLLRGDAPARARTWIDQLSEAAHEGASLGVPMRLVADAYAAISRGEEARGPSSYAEQRMRRLAEGEPRQIDVVALRSALRRAVKAGVGLDARQVAVDALEKAEVEQAARDVVAAGLLQMAAPPSLDASATKELRKALAETATMELPEDLVSAVQAKGAWPVLAAGCVVAFCVWCP
eukprot:947190-Pleurochrysis_carterae.AAC.1